MVFLDIRETSKLQNIQSLPSYDLQSSLSENTNTMQWVDPITFHHLNGEMVTF